MGILNKVQVIWVNNDHFIARGYAGHGVGMLNPDMESQRNLSCLR